jgi:hypothetical protein
VGRRVKVDVPAVEDAGEPVLHLTQLLTRILAGHGGTVSPATIDGRLYTAVTVEMPGANTLLVTVSEP